MSQQPSAFGVLQILHKINRDLLMPHFSSTSKQRLDTCHPDLKVLFETLVEKYDCTIICGHRNEKDQNAAYDGGKSQLRWPDGKHNSIPSEGVDAGPWPLDWNDVRGICAFAGWVLCTARDLYDRGMMDHRVRWGGDWDMDHSSVDQKFNDLVHFELVPIYG